MRGTQTNEFDIEFPASEIWNVYGTLVLPEVVKSIPNLLKDIQVTGDGSVGTIFDNYLLPGGPYEWFRERIVTLDEKKRIKEVQVIEGGNLTLGYVSFLTRFEIVEKGSNLTTVRSSITYEIKDEDSANESLATVSTLGIFVNAVVQYLRQKSTTSSIKE